MLVIVHSCPSWPSINEGCQPPSNLARRGFIDQFWSHSWRANTNMKVVAGHRQPTIHGVDGLHDINFCSKETTKTRFKKNKYSVVELHYSTTVPLLHKKFPGFEQSRRQVMVLLLYYNQAVEGAGDGLRIQPLSTMIHSINIHQHPLTINKPYFNHDFGHPKY